MNRSLPQGSTIYGDGVDNSYELEDIFQQDEHLHLLAKLRSRTSRAHGPELERMIRSKRQRIETAFSQITAYLA